MVLAADVRVCRCKFGIAERTDEGHDATEQPQAKKSHLARNVRRDHRRRLEYADTDDDANEHGARLKGGKRLLEYGSLLPRLVNG